MGALLDVDDPIADQPGWYLDLNDIVDFFSHQGLADRLAIYQARGEFRDLDPQLVAASLAGMLEWHVFTTASFGVPGPIEDSDQVIDTIADLWAAAVDVGGSRTFPPAD